MFSRFFLSSGLRIALVFMAVGLMSACASKQDKATCDKRDWFELGRRDGAQGAATDRQASYRNECGTTFSGFAETMYTNGRNAGLVEYCDVSNAYELGRMGLPYLYVCPSTIEPKFLSSYRKGQEARKLEVQNQKIDAEIDELLAKLNYVDSSYARREIASEVEQLRKERIKNDKDLSKYSN